jgi:hypothetical protein
MTDHVAHCEHEKGRHIGIYEEEELRGYECYSPNKLTDCKKKD